MKEKDDPPPTTAEPKWQTFRDVFELMLSVDYGFPAYPLRRLSGVPKSPEIGQLTEFQHICFDLVKAASCWLTGRGIPSPELWDGIACVAETWESMPLGLSACDIAVLLWHYNSRGTPVSSKEHEQGWTGYTGILQEMKDEVPTRGTARLERKLSLDVRVLIPQCVRDRKRQRQLISAAQGFAAEYGCELAPVATPPTPVWRRYLSSIGGHLSFKASVGHGENEETKKLLGGTQDGYESEIDDQQSCGCCSIA